MGLDCEDCFLSIPTLLNERLLNYRKAKKVYDKRQPIILIAIDEYLTKNGF